ncbi:MAG: InlB B-repeat-containing protein [Anaerovoracaceae bacterium]
MKRDNKGFTLIEIIIAVALIGIIAVGIIPVFAAQFKMTIDSRDITKLGFHMQGELEDAIFEAQELIKGSGVYGGTLIAGLSKEDKSIFGRDISAYRLSRDYPSGNKTFVIFLSEKLAEMSFRKPLIASMVRIDGERNNGTIKEGIEVASVRDSSDLKLLKGVYEIEDYTSIQDLNLYRWYRSVEGLADPKFPEDYEFISEWRNKKTISKEELKALAANRFLMLSLIPVDKSGVRGAEKPSSNSVYIQGDEWRSGIFAWVDKDGDGSYDGDLDVSVNHGSDSNKPNWVLINGFNSKVNFPSPENPTINLDPSDGSLYVPMGVWRNRNTDKVGKIEIKTTDTNNFINWQVDKNIHFANDIEVKNNTDISMFTEDGGITLYQYVDINTSNGEALFNADGSVKLVDNGAKLETYESIILQAGDKWGNLSIEPYTSLTAGKDMDLTAAEMVIIKGSTLTSGEDITIKSKKKEFLIEDTDITARKLNLKVNGIMKGGGWSAETGVVVPNGTILKAEKGSGIIHNEGSLSLSDTGAIVFPDGNASTMKKPLALNLLRIDGGTIGISTTNYYRNLGVAGNEVHEVGYSESYKDLGKGTVNLQYLVERNSEDGSPSISLSFNSQGRITISAQDSSQDEYANSYTLKVRDKYAEGVYGTIPFRIYKEEGGLPSVEAGEGGTAETRTVTFDANGGSFSGGSTTLSVNVNRGESLGGAMPDSPTRSGYKFTGWKRLGGSDFNGNTIVISNITVKAQWEVVPQVTVTFNPNGGNFGGSTNSVVVTVNEGVSVGSQMPNDPVRSGYVFKGWNTYSNGNGSTFTANTAVNGDMTVYAQWEQVSKYTVTFNPNGGNFGGSTNSIAVTVNEGDSVGSQMPNDPVRSGYIFKGWNTNRYGNGSTFTANTAVNANTTVYAQWEQARQYTVTFNANGGSFRGGSTTVSVTVPEGSSVGSQMPNNPTRRGYTFSSWNTNSNGRGTTFTNATPVTGNITVYAQWRW